MFSGKAAKHSGCYYIITESLGNHHYLLSMKITVNHLYTLLRPYKISTTFIDNITTHSL